MKWSATVATIAGTKVRIHFTFLILLAWVMAEYGAKGGVPAALGALGLYLSLFLCVLLHEFGHVTAARIFGVRTPTITLLPIGGVAQLERMPKEPRSELVIALAGPLVNVIIVAVLWSVTSLAPKIELNLPLDPAEPIPLLKSIIWVNVMLVVFNLIPAFPMDGGRVLRALMAFVMPWEKATKQAAAIGQILALTGGILALFAHNPFLLIIALFIFLAAGGEAAFAERENLLAGVAVSSAANGNFETLKADSTIGEAVEQLLDGSQHDFPVVDAAGVCIGILSRTHLIRALSEKGEASLVGDAMATEFPSFELSAPVIDAWKTLTEMGLSVAPVVGSSGKLVKWLTIDNIAELIMTRGAVAKP